MGLNNKSLYYRDCIVCYLLQTGSSRIKYSCPYKPGPDNDRSLQDQL